MSKKHPVNDMEKLARLIRRETRLYRRHNAIADHQITRLWGYDDHDLRIAAECKDVTIRIERLLQRSPFIL